MGRPLEFNKDEVLEKAMNVFWRRGYEATSLQELIEAMDLSKSSFYQSFASKQDLFVKCLEKYQSKLSSDLSDNFVKARTARQFIEQTFREITNTAQKETGKMGCFLMNSPNEFSFEDEKLSPSITVGFRKLQTVWQIAVKQAQKEGDISAEKDAESLAYYIISSISGLRTMIKAGANAEIIGKIKENILLTIFS